MSVRGWITVALTGALVAGFALTGASPASARPNTDCATIDVLNVDGDFSDGYFNAAAGDIISVDVVYADHNDWEIALKIDDTSVDSGATPSDGVTPLHLTYTFETAAADTFLWAGRTFAPEPLVFSYTWSCTNPSGGAGGAAPVQPFTLTWNTADAWMCWPTVTAEGGAWLKLTAEGCTAPTGHDGAVLLGWSTSPKFPVSRAQSQVDKHWGAIDETIDGVRMIFIPLNGYTCITGDNTLYPIWSK